jgi:hypothetical protein
MNFQKSSFNESRDAAEKVLRSSCKVLLFLEPSHRKRKHVRRMRVLGQIGMWRRVSRFGDLTQTKKCFVLHVKWNDLYECTNHALCRWNIHFQGILHICSRDTSGKVLCFAYKVSLCLDGSHRKVQIRILTLIRVKASKTYSRKTTSVFMWRAVIVASKTAKIRSCIFNDQSGKSPQWKPRYSRN